MDGIISEIIKDTAIKSGLTEDKIEDITSHMVEYLKLGSPYGISEQGFYEWYTKEKGGKINVHTNS